MYAFELRIFLKVILLEGVSVEIIKSHAFSGVQHCFKKINSLKSLFYWWLLFLTSLQTHHMDYTLKRRETVSSSFQRRKQALYLQGNNILTFLKAETFFQCQRKLLGFHLSSIKSLLGTLLGTFCFQFTFQRK